MSQKPSAYPQTALERGKKRAKIPRGSAEAGEGSKIWGVFHACIMLVENGHLRDMSGHAAKVYIALFQAINVNSDDPDRTCWPSVKTISTQTKLSRSVVFRALKELEDLALFHRVRQGGGYHPVASNKYELATPQERPEHWAINQPDEDRPVSNLTPVKPLETRVKSDTLPVSNLTQTRVQPDTQSMKEKQESEVRTGGGGGGSLFSSSEQAIGRGHPIYDFLTSDKIKIWPDSAAKLIQSQPNLSLYVVAQEWENVKNDRSVKINRGAALLARLNANGPRLLRDREQEVADHKTTVERYHQLREQERAVESQVAPPAEDVRPVTVQQEADKIPDNIVDAVLNEAERCIGLDDATEEGTPEHDAKRSRCKTSREAMARWMRTQPAEQISIYIDFYSESANRAFTYFADLGGTNEEYDAIVLGVGQLTPAKAA